MRCHLPVPSGLTSSNCGHQLRTVWTRVGDEGSRMEPDLFLVGGLSGKACAEPWGAGGASGGQCCWGVVRREGRREWPRPHPQVQTGFPIASRRPSRVPVWWCVMRVPCPAFCMLKGRPGRGRLGQVTPAFSAELSPGAASPDPEPPWPAVRHLPPSPGPCASLPRPPPVLAPRQQPLIEESLRKLRN